MASITLTQNAWRITGSSSVNKTNEQTKLQGVQYTTYKPFPTWFPCRESNPEINHSLWTIPRKHRTLRTETDTWNVFAISSPTHGYSRPTYPFMSIPSFTVFPRSPKLRRLNQWTLVSSFAYNLRTNIHPNPPDSTSKRIKINFAIVTQRRTLCSILFPSPLPFNRL